MKVSTFRNNHGDPPKINVNLPEISEVTKNSKRWKDVQLPIDILLLTVKDCEFLSCYYYINDPFRSYFKGLGPVYFGSIGEDQDVKLNVALMKCLKCSRVPGSALAVVNTAVIQLRPKAVFSVGHCSGMNQESTKLGDVVVSEKLTTFSYQKVTKDGRKFCGLITLVSRDIAELIKSTAYSWNPPLENPRKRKVEVHCGEVLNGSELVQAEWQRDELMKSFPEAIAIETEGEGIFSAAHDLKMEWVVVKGISGYTDGTESKKNWQTFASVTAASFVVNVLKKCSNFEDWPHYKGSTEHLPWPKVKRRKEESSPSDASTPKKRKTGFADPIPYYIKARGTIGLEAYRRALEAGETFDRRTKIALIGQDRVGKTSLRRYLRGEAFDEDEASTNGIEMISPIKNAGKGAWRNPAPLENIRALDHKCAEVAAKEVLISSEERPHRVQLFAGEGKKTRGEPTIGKGATQERSNDDLASKEVIKKNVFQEVKSEKKPEDVPEKVLSLVERGLKGNDTSDNEGVWLFVWDFAGQAVYHAIHPIFLSQEAIYVLVSDLTKELSAPAQCRIRPPNHDEIEVNSPYVEDTNLDHMMRWLDLVHSLGRPEFQRKSENTKDVLPPVVLVGTHADGVRDPGKEMESVKETICSMARSATLGHISKESFFIDNTNPNRENDPQIVSLRAELLDLAEKMPHINKVIPMQWLRVEQKVEEMVKEKGMHYVGKKRFAEDISGGICQFNDTDDVEELLHFLQARGRIIYQDLPENPDGLVVLDPQWLMKILCEIITVRPVWKNDPVIQKDYQVLGNKGLLSQQLLNRVFERLELNDIKNSLIHIMESFDVICNSKNCKGEDYPYFVPCLLKSPKKNTRGTNMRSGPLPIFLSFNTNYVPSGLFFRLVVHFWEWASQLCGSCIAPTLFANAAKFNVSKVYQVTLECHKTVIEVIIRTPRDSDKMEEKRICEELLSHLERCRTRLSVTCPWLRSVTMQLFLKCQLCEPCPDKCRGGTNICILHKEEGCSHYDCGHYIPLRSFGLSCEHSVDAVPHYPAEKLDPWVQALESIERKKRTGCSTKHLRRPKVKRRDKESSHSDALTPKKRKHGLAGGSTEHLPRPKVKRLKEESSPSDASTPKKRKTGFAVKQGIPSDEDLGWLSEEVEKKWKAVGRRLGIQEARLTAFDNENREYFGKMYKMLLHWREKNGSAATYTVLHDALCHPLVNRTDLAEQLGANSNLPQFITDKCRGGTNICILFKEEGCSDFDNFPLRKFGLWKNSVGAVPYYPAKKLDPWAQALESKKRTGNSTKHLRRPKVNRRDEESSPCDALTAKKRKTGFAVKE